MTAAPERSAPGPLTGLRVLDLSTLFAGPITATLLGDYGAGVIKIENPRKPDAARGHGFQKDGEGLWWKSLGRNKQTIAVNLSDPAGAEIVRELAADCDVIIENFRPGVLDRWELGFEHLHALNPGLVMLSVTGFGQFGPKSSEPGFGTLAEAMSGFATMTGQPDGPPTLPPLALADSISGIMGAFAVMTALHERAASGTGQHIDVSLIESMLAALGPQVSVYDQLGIVPRRLGNRSENNAPRNLYETADGRWLAVSTSSQSIADRVLRLVGRPDVVDEDWFQSAEGRVAHADELDEAVAAWVRERPAEEALKGFREAQAAASLAYDAGDILADPQYGALGSVIDIEDERLGAMKMLNVPFRLSRTPGSVDWTGRDHGADTDAVVGALGHDADQLARLRDRGVIA